MVEVNVADLNGEDKDALGSFIESKLPVKLDRKGDTISFDDKSERTHVRAPEVRTYLKRFMHEHDLKKEFRLLSEDGALKFVKRPKHEIEANKEEEEAESGNKSK